MDQSGLVDQWHLVDLSHLWHLEHPEHLEHLEHLFAPLDLVDLMDQSVPEDQ
jgi:hypothetical protein